MAEAKQPDLGRRALEVLAQRPPAFDLKAFCFREQLAAVEDRAKFKANCTSRRAGKTIAIAAKKLFKAQLYPDVAQLYITLSRLNAKRIIWGDLLKLNRIYQMGGIPNETELTIRFPNGHVIYCSGAKDKTEIEKYRGFPLIDVDVDEAQAFRAYLQELVDDVLAKSLYDYDGELSLWGTPPPVPVGYFHDCWNNKEWSHHHWTMLQNPHLKAKSGKDPMELIQADCRRMGISIDHPRIQRECFGRWVVDSDRLVFRWSEANHYDELPEAKTWERVLGVDLGYTDADAIAVIGWNEKSPDAWLEDEVVKAKQGVTELAETLKAMVARYQPISIVMDTGGLGKKIAEELISRHGLPIKPAVKTEKFSHIELLNDAMRTRRFRAKRTSAFAEDCHLVEWDRDKSSGDRLVVSDAYHSDICDAVLYAFREALHWLHEPPKPKPASGTEAWFREEEAKIIEREEEKLRRRLDEEDPDYWPPPEDEGW